MAHENDEIEREESEQDLGNDREWDADRILGYMREKGIASVMVRYAGAGDEGGCESVTALDASGRELAASTPIDEAFLEACEERGDEAIHRFAGSYEDNDGGKVEWKLAADGRVTLDLWYNELVPQHSGVWESDVDGLEFKSAPPKDNDLDPDELLRDATAVLRDLRAGYQDKDLHCDVDELMKKLGRYYREVVGDAEILPTKEAEESGRDDSAPAMG